MIGDTKTRDEMGHVNTSVRGESAGTGAAVIFSGAGVFNPLPVCQLSGFSHSSGSTLCALSEKAERRCR